MHFPVFKGTNGGTSAGDGVEETAFTVLARTVGDIARRHGLAT